MQAGLGGSHCFLSVPQVLGREGPFPLILLPQFGGYWIEGTNHELASVPETEQLQSPTSKVKLECNHTARIYRKHFLGKVRPPTPASGPGPGREMVQATPVLSSPWGVSSPALPALGLCPGLVACGTLNGALVKVKDPRELPLALVRQTPWSGGVRLERAVVNGAGPNQGKMQGWACSFCSHLC